MHCMPCDHLLMTVLQVQAVNGGTDRNVVVYTPCIVLEDGLHLYNFTLPNSMVCSDVLPDLGMPQTEPMARGLILHHHTRK